MLHVMKMDGSMKDLVIFGYFGIVMIAIYMGQQYLRSRRTKWMPIGYIKNIYIYPIEGGYRKEVKQIECSCDGLTTYDDQNNILWEDRKYLIYSDSDDNNEPGSVQLHNADLVSLKPDILKEIETKPRLQIVKFPDGTLTYVHDCGDSISNILKDIYGVNKKFKLGSRPKYSKKLLFKCRRYTKEKIIVTYTCLNPEFSMCSLVNDGSVKDLKHNISGSDKLTHLNFRPNFVIESYKYAEDEVEFLKIGTVKFSNVLPCAVDEYVNIDPELGTISNNRQPYLTLFKNRKLKDVRPDMTITSSMPVFGITLHDVLSSTGKIAVGDQVYAQFFDRS